MYLTTVGCIYIQWHQKAAQTHILFMHLICCCYVALLGEEFFNISALKRNKKKTHTHSQQQHI